MISFIKTLTLIVVYAPAKPLSVLYTADSFCLWII